MKKIFKVLAYILAGLFLIALLVYLFFQIKWNRTSAANLASLGDPAPTLTINNQNFRDLNKNGQLDVYEDVQAPLEARVENLLQQMNVEEKAGLLFITMTGMHPEGALLEKPIFSEPFTFVFGTNSTMVAQKKMNHFNIMQSTTPEAMIAWHNNFQKLAERSRLGIPITIASDPRHGVEGNPGASIPTPFFSSWCSPLGFAAIGDTLLMREFGDIARQEYNALGIRLGLSPMADLATEPRWGRINGTFGEDAELSAQLTKAYILGFQGDSLSKNSVACMTKHFPGGGPQKDGEDAHFPYGADQAYPGDNFDYHLIPFEKGAFAAKTAQIMPYYGVPVGQTEEQVAFGFNKEIITNLLRKKYGFDGVVCTDWNLIIDSPVKPASAWGVENLTPIERIAKVMDAGCDMFGGESCPDLLVELIESGQIKESRIDVSVRRVLRDKFRLGLFDNPYLEEGGAAMIGKKEFQEKGRAAQRKSLVLLKNEAQILPLKKGTKVYVQGMDAAVAEQFTDLVTSPKEADCILLRLKTPYEPRSTYMLEQFFHQGRLHFTEEEKADLLPLIKSKPTITVMSLERAAIFPEINAHSQAVIADFHCQEDIIMELIFGQFEPSGKLPIELPSSVEAVKAQKEDVPYDSVEPLYRFGHGLGYGSAAVLN